MPGFWKQDELINKWKLIRKVRRIVNTAIENVRNQKLIGSSLETEIYIYVDDNNLRKVLKNIDMKKILMVSKFIFLDNTNDKAPESLYETNIKEENIFIQIKKTTFLKCIRCWQYLEEVTAEEELCFRCKQTLASNV